MWYLNPRRHWKSHEVIASYFTICASTVVVIANGNFGLNDITKQSTTITTAKHNNESQGETPVVAKELSNHCYSGSLINQDRIGVDPVWDPERPAAATRFKASAWNSHFWVPGFSAPIRGVCVVHIIHVLKPPLFSLDSLVAWPDESWVWNIGGSNPSSWITF